MQIIIDLIANTHRKHWAVLIIELIALIFKDQHVDQMSMLLSKMNEATKSNGSEDDESNTSQPHPVITIIHMIYLYYYVNNMCLTKTEL